MLRTAVPKTGDLRVAVMQPYFYPYMGYFRLMAAVDIFVLFDCVQFPRRGRVHRSEVPHNSGGSTWLTLPLASAPQQTRIDAMRFAPDAASTFGQRCASLTWLDGLPASVTAALTGPMDRPIDYLEQNLVAVARYLGLSTRVERSSRYAIPAEIRRGARVRAVAKAVGATQYVNAPGGRGLYHQSEFIADGLALSFLPHYDGVRRHMLHALATEPCETLAEDARTAIQPEPAQ
ncbi:MAG: WbqC family protein [Pseudomonadota bacterium]